MLCFSGLSYDSLGVTVMISILEILSPALVLSIFILLLKGVYVSK